MRGVDSVQQHTISTFPASTTAPFTATMNTSSSSEDAVDGAKVMLSEQEDSGLGSMTGYPSISNSIELEEQRLHGLGGFTRADKIFKDSAHDGALTGSTQLRSLTSELDQLKLNSLAGEDTEDCLRDAAMMPGHKEAEHDSLLCDIDSGNFSITTTSIAPTDFNGVPDVPQKQFHEEKESKLNIKMGEKEDDEVDCCNMPRQRLFVSPEQRVALYQGNADGDNCLHLSIIYGQARQAMTVMRLAPDYMWLSFSNLLRQTPLHLAVLTGQTHIVRRLVCAGALVDAQDLNGNTPLHCACHMGLESAVRNLLAPVRYEETRRNSWEIPYQRLPQDLSVRNSEGQTPLHVAVMSGHVGVVKLLLGAGADPNMGEAKSGRTPLHLAAERGQVGLVELLVEMPNTDILARNYAGLTAAQLALGRNLHPIANFLQVCCDDTSDAESDVTLIDTDSDSDYGEVGME